MGLGATFSSISAISWRRKPEGTTDLGQVTDKPYHVRLQVECSLFVVYKVGREIKEGLYCRELICLPFRQNKNVYHRFLLQKRMI
jgi:hypothetical protein